MLQNHDANEFGVAKSKPCGWFALECSVLRGPGYVRDWEEEVFWPSAPPGPSKDGTEKNNAVLPTPLVPLSPMITEVAPGAHAYSVWHV